MHGAMIDLSSLGEGLDAPARRRLWLLGQVIQGNGVADVRSALASAALLEEFVVTGCRGGNRGASDIQIEAPAACAPVPMAQTPERDGAARRARGEESHARGLPLDRETRERFIAEAVRNPDNRHLAATFGLTVRQAHAVRVAFRQFIAAAGALSEDQQHRSGTARPTFTTSLAPSDPFTVERVRAPSRSQTSPVRRLLSRADKRAKHGVILDRETELRMEEEFLAKKSSPIPTMEDVVRFLRQQGDVVVAEEAGYRVNYARHFSPDELVARANCKRASLGLTPFAVSCAARPPAAMNRSVVASTRS